MRHRFGLFTVAALLALSGSPATCTDDAQTGAPVVRVAGLAGGDSSPLATVCVPDSVTLCLYGGRFKVQADYRDYAGQAGAGRAVAMTADTGYFWFFTSTNVEAVTKIVSFCSASSKNFGFYAGGLTDVYTKFKVTDTQTGEHREFVNPLGTPFTLIRDGSFACPGASPPDPPDGEWLAVDVAADAPAAACTNDDTTLCLFNDRFQFRATYRDYGGHTGPGHAVRMTSDTGYFWFFGSSNVEAIAKIVDFCGSTGRNYGVYIGGMTDVEVHLFVTDTASGATREFINPLGRGFTLIRDGSFACTAAPTTPAAPANLTATAAGSSAIALAWTDMSSNEDGFRIERGPAAGGPFTAVGTAPANATSWNATGLAPSTTYWFRVRAYNSAGNSAYSAAAQATTSSGMAVPGTPGSLSATATGTTSIGLTWSDSNNEDGFRIERSGTGSGSGFTEVGTAGVNVTTWSSTGLTPGTQYWFRVRAYNSAGNSGYSPVASATTSNTTAPPSAPSGLTVNATSPTAITLHWSDNSSNETKFEIDVLTVQGNIGIVTWPAANATSYQLTVQEGDTRLGYRVLAINGAGQSAPTPWSYAPPKLRVINDLYNQTFNNTDWAKLNTVIRVRIGPTANAVINDTMGTYERLQKSDLVSSVTLADEIDPSSTAANKYRDFDVSANGPNYYIYVQCGWWDWDAFIYLWKKHDSAVLCQNGNCCCTKAAYWSATSHTSGYLVLRISTALPRGHWNGML